MGVGLAAGYTQVSYTWTTWKTAQQTKRFNTSYFDDGVIYTIWGYDGPEVHVCNIFKGVVPDGVAATYSQSQNDTDKTDFETTYKPFANRQLQRQDRSQVLTSSTITATGSSVAAGINASANYLIINIKNAPTGTSPSITFSVQDVDPIDQTTLMGSATTFTAMTALGVQENAFLCNSGSAKITWTVTGTSPSFTGVNVSVVCKDGVSSGANLSTVGSTTPTIAGLVGGSDGTNMRAIKMATDGTVRIDPTGTTTQPVSGTGSFTVAQATAANLNATVTGTVSVGNFPGTQPVSGTVTATVASTGSVGSAAPGSATYVGALNNAGTAMSPLNLDASGNLKVVSSGGSSASVGTLNTTAPTSGNTMGGIDATGKIQAVQVDNILGQTPKQMSVAATLTSPGAATRGIYAYTNAYGTLRVSGESTTLFNDNFDQGVDANKWTTSKISGGGTITFSSGTGNVNSGTTASAYSVLTSVPTFTNYGSTFLVYATVASVAGPTTGSYRFFGIGNSATTPTCPTALASTSTAVVDAIGFEYDTAGNFYAVIYSNTTNIYRSAALTAPTGSQSRYGFQLRADVVIFYVGTTEYPAATANYQTTSNCVLPVLTLSVNGGSTLGSAVQINLQALGIGDSGKNSAQLSDATYPWRKATVDSTGALKITGSVSAGGAADTTASGTLGALNATASIAMAGQNSCGMQLSAGTLIGTIVAEVSIDGGTTWVGTYFDDPTVNSKVSSITFSASNTAVTRTIVGVGGSSNIRVRVSAYTSGTASCALRASTTNDPSGLFTAQSGNSLPVTTALFGGQSGKQLISNRVDRLGTTKVGFDTILFQDSVEGTTLNPLIWTTVTNVSTIAQTVAGGIAVNANNNTLSGSYAILRSAKKFQIMNSSPLRAVFVASMPSATNTQLDLGFGSPATGAAAVSPGAWFSWSSAGVLSANLNNANGSSTITTTISGFATGSFVIYSFIIEYRDTEARFIIEDITGTRLSDITLSQPSATGSPIHAGTHESIFARMYNVTAPSIIAGAIFIYSVTVSSLDINSGKKWETQLAGLGRTATFDPIALAQTSNVATAAAPSTGTPSNTAALYTTLGGEFIANATATSESLLSIFAYTIPSPYSFYLQGISIPPLIVSGAAVATTATVVEFCVIANCASANISTGGGQRFSIPGFFQVASGAAIGTVWTGQPCSWSVQTPILCLPGTVLHIAYKVIIGTATASNRNRGNVYVDGFFE